MGRAALLCFADGAQAADGSVSFAPKEMLALKGFGFLLL